MSYILNVEQRTAAIAALERCKKKLWNGKDEGAFGGDDCVSEFICISISRSYVDSGFDYGKGYGVQEAREIIQKSIAPYSIYEDWLKKNGHRDVYSWSDTKLQAQRLRFVNSCIRALKASLK